MTGEETVPVRPRIYAACLAAYSAGRSHGRWIDALQEPAEISAEIRAMLAASPVPGAEEWAIHDHQGFGDALVSELETVERIAAIAALLRDYPAAVVARFVDGSGAGLAGEALREAFEDAYGGSWEHAEGLAHDVLIEDGEVSERLALYLDYDRLVQDEEINGSCDLVKDGDLIHILWKRR
ncbi:antirestriction protein ArdA [Planobispora takensis]|uniref:Antirestriction protein ArdA n=1 Tax=Planobispora takensis TaxID=1367882 RepID=A0A8J3SRB0_9ACTN|nr:antirestriction protein ArdA [Planobispora takensis]GIH99173.1 antirestriction protein ArdA [Planobispora takensis]